MQLGLTMAVSVLVCFYAAWLLEQRFYTGGILPGLGILLGIAAGGWAAYRTTLKLLAHPDDDPPSQ
ncbi:MAG: AtpZ/AtpI family protein [Candidatus Cloacimonetes bacterium]|nr:AtpZ/AtpI family protein [Candidatus Cloacimonadota bacterium]